MLNDEEKEKIRLMRNEYHRKWRQENPQKIQVINERYWKKKLEEQKQESRKEEQE